MLNSRVVNYVHLVLSLSIFCVSRDSVFVVVFYKTNYIIIKRLLGSVFVLSGIIKVSVSVIS